MSLCKLVVIFGASTALLLTTCYSQTFDPNVDDQEYLAEIQKRLRSDVVKAHGLLINETKVLQEATRSFIESKIKENLFKAVRARVEMELESMAEHNVSFRQARQSEDNEDDDEPATTTRPPGLLPQLANVVSTLFGNDVNVTSYVREATSFLPPDISYRIVSAVNLIDPQRFTSTTTSTSTTLSPVVVINGQVIPQVNNSAYIDYQSGIARPQPQTQNPTQQVSVTPLQSYQHSAFPQSPGVDRVNQGVVQSGTYLKPSEDRVVQLQGQGQGIPQTGGGVVSAPEVETQQQQNQLVSVNDIQNQPQLQPQLQQLQLQQQQPLSHVASVVSVPSRAKLVSPAVVTLQPGQAVPAPGAILIQPESYQQNVPSIQILSPQTSTATQAQYNSEEEEDISQEDIVSDTTTTERIQNEEDSAEDDFAEFLQDEPARTEPPRGGLIGNYPALSYAFKLFNRLNNRNAVPTTTEFSNVTRKSIDSIEEEEARATSPATTTFQTIVQGGVYLYEGAREAYTLLQHLNKFLDRVGTRLDSAGLGVEPVAAPAGSNFEDDSR